MAAARPCHRPHGAGAATQASSDFSARARGQLTCSLSAGVPGPRRPRGRNDHNWHCYGPALGRRRRLLATVGLGPRLLRETRQRPLRHGRPGHSRTAGGPGGRRRVGLSPRAARPRRPHRYGPSPPSQRRRAVGGRRRGRPGSVTHSESVAGQVTVVVSPAGRRRPRRRCGGPATVTVSGTVTQAAAWQAQSL